MNGIEHILSALFQWVLSASTVACFVVVLIVAGKKAIGNRLPPRWHYLLWFVLIAKLLLPWQLESPFSLWNLVPASNYPAVNAIFETTSAMTQETSAGPNITWLVLFFVWLSGALFTVLHAYAANRRFDRKLRTQTTVDDPAILHLLEECKTLMSVRRKIRLVESELVSGPALFGFLHPCLIVPQLNSLALRPDQLRFIFLHELAHVKRNDIAVNWFMRLLLAVHWFNPFVWYAFYRMREDQEAACDALALSHVHPDETNTYGHALIDLYEKASARMKIAGLASLTGNMPQIKRRILLIRSYRRSSRRRSLVGAVVLIALCLGVFTVGGESKVVASLGLPVVDSTVTEERIMPISHIDEYGNESWFNLLVFKDKGEWKLEFLTEAGEPDPAGTKESAGTLIVPETGMYSRPGTLDLVFVKKLSDKEWKLDSIVDRWGPTGEEAN